jgi:hypothetical protein
MKIFAHRGLWRDLAEQNTLVAIDAAFCRGMSVEIDLWKKDESGAIWVGHDIGIANTNFEDVLAIWMAYDNVDLALNIKCDGLLESLNQHFGVEGRKQKNGYFAFDMSMPERYLYIKNGFPIAHRISEFELSEMNLEGKIFWLDSFESDWYLALEDAQLAKLLKSSVVVSPELHSRPTDEVHQRVLKYDTFGICLDNVRDFDDYR